MRRIFTIIAAAGLLWGTALTGAAAAGYGDYVVPTWAANGESAVVDYDTAKLEGGNTSIETGNLGVNVDEGTTISFAYELVGDAKCEAGAPRMFVEVNGVIGDNKSTTCDSTGSDAASGTITFQTVNAGLIERAGLVYDSGRGGHVLISGVTVDGTHVYFAEPPAPEPPAPQNPAATIGDGHCPTNDGQGGVIVTLDNTESPEPALFVVESDFGDDDRSREREVAAGETDEVVAYAPEDVAGNVRVLVGDEVLAEEEGTLNCLPDESETPTPTPGNDQDGNGDQGKGDESPVPAPAGDDVKGDAKEVVAVSDDQGKGGLPVTGSPLRLIAAVAAGLLALGGSILGGLRLARNRG